MPKFLILIVLFLAITLVIFSFSELQSVILTLQQANIWFVILAATAEAGWAFVLGSIFHSIYSLLGIVESRRRLTLLGLASTFLGVVTTTAVGGLAMFLADGRRRGHPTGKVTVASALYLLLDYAAFFCVLAVGIVVLIRRNNLGAGEVSSASLILLAVAVALGAILLLAYKSPVALGSWLASAARVINRLLRPFIHRAVSERGRAHEFAGDISSGLGSLPEKPRTLLIPFLLALLNKILLAVILMLCFLAFDVPFTAGTIVGEFAITYLFIIVSPTPAGVGVVEGLMPVALRTLRVDFSQAVIVTLAFRGITFWLPLAAGAAAFRHLHVDVDQPEQAPVRNSDPEG